MVRLRYAFLNVHDPVGGNSHSGSAAGCPRELDHSAVRTSEPAGGRELPESPEEVRPEVGSVDIISVTEAARILDITYHRLLGWIKRSRYGLGKRAWKLKGGGWVVSRAAVTELSGKLASQSGPWPRSKKK